MKAVLINKQGFTKEIDLPTSPPPTYTLVEVPPISLGVQRNLTYLPEGKERIFYRDEVKLGVQLTYTEK